MDTTDLPIFDRYPILHSLYLKVTHKNKPQIIADIARDKTLPTILDKLFSVWENERNLLIQEKQFDNLKKLYILWGFLAQFPLLDTPDSSLAPNLETPQNEDSGVEQEFKPKAKKPKIEKNIWIDRSFPSEIQQFSSAQFKRPKDLLTIKDPLNPDESWKLDWKENDDFLKKVGIPALVELASMSSIGRPFRVRYAAAASILNFDVYAEYLGVYLETTELEMNEKLELNTLLKLTEDRTRKETVSEAIGPMIKSYCQTFIPPHDQKTKEKELLSGFQQSPIDAYRNLLAKINEKKNQVRFNPDVEYEWVQMTGSNTCIEEEEHYSHWNGFLVMYQIQKVNNVLFDVKMRNRCNDGGVSPDGECFIHFPWSLRLQVIQDFNDPKVAIHKVSGKELKTGSFFKSRPSGANFIFSYQQPNGVYKKIFYYGSRETVKKRSNPVDCGNHLNV